MQINGYSSGGGYVKSLNPGKIGNVPLPNFGSFYFPTRRDPAMSESEYKQAIINQAKIDVENGTSQSSADYKRLMNSYVSCVSPDRKGIITAGLKKIASKEIPETLNIIELTYGVKFQKVIDSKPYIEFYDGNGEMVATYSNTGWNYFSTKAEDARTSEFLSIYNSAHKSFREEKAEGNSI